MARLHPKTEDAVAAAFISNCQANNFRLQALEMLENLNIKIGSYGLCHQDHDGDVDKDETLRHYKFSLAFENSNEKDYVTEKFFHSLVAGGSTEFLLIHLRPLLTWHQFIHLVVFAYFLQQRYRKPKKGVLVFRSRPVGAAAVQELCSTCSREKKEDSSLKASI